MKLKRLIVKNWLSFKEFDYTFENKPLQIQGSNQTDDGQLSNGSGKSAFQAVIEKLIFDTTSRKTLDKNLIRFGEDFSEIELFIECSIRKEMLRIKRVLKQKGSNELRLFINGKEVKFSSIKDGNDFIISWIGISKEDLQNNFIVNKDRFTSFLTSSNSKKIELINRFSNASLIDGVTDYIDEDLLDVDKEIEKQRKIISMVEGKIDLLNKQFIKEQNRDIKKEIEEEIEEFEGKILLCKNDNNEIPKKIESFNKKLNFLKENRAHYNNKIKELENKIKENNFDDFNILIEEIEEKKYKLKKQVKNKQAEIDIINNDLNEAKLLLNEIIRNLQGSIKCPNCGFEFIVGDENVNIEDEKRSKIEVEKIIENCNLNINIINNKIKNNFDNKIEELNEQENEVNESLLELKKEINVIKNKIRGHEDEIFSLDKEEKRIFNEIENLQELIKINNNKIKTYQKNISDLLLESVENKKIKEIQNEIKLNKSQLKKNKKNLENFILQQQKIKSWLINFKRFKQFLAVKSLKIIEGYCNKYLEKMDSDLRIKLEGFKVKSNGDIKEEITPYILRNGELKNYNTFSGGERGRLQYSMILALQYMINSTNENGGLKFLIVDEAIEGIDSLGLDNTIKALKIFNFPILITTHVQNINNFDNILLIEKTNGISNIVLN